MLEKWRKEDITTFIHIHDGILTGKTFMKTRRVAELAQSELAKFGFIILEEKCMWSLVQKLVRTGIEWDLVKFECRIPQL